MLFGKQRAVASISSLDADARLAGQVAQQKASGEQLYAAIQRATADNPNMEGGRTLLVSKMEDNAGKFSVVVRLRDPYGTHTMMQFDVGMENLHSLYGPHGPSEDFPLEEFEAMEDKACTRVRTFT